MASRGEGAHGVAPQPTALAPGQAAMHAHGQRGIVQQTGTDMTLQPAIAFYQQDVWDV